MRTQLIAKGQQLKEELAVLERDLNIIENALQVEGQRLPNSTHPDVPIGVEGEAKTIRTFGSQQPFDFEVSHLLISNIKFMCGTKGNKRRSCT